MPQSPENLTTMLALLACSVDPGLTNQIYLGLLTRPLFTTGHEMDGEKTDCIN